MKVLIADDHPLLRRGLCAYFEKMQKYQVVAQAGNGEEVIDYIHNIEFDLAILDINFPKFDGFEILSIMRKECADVQIIVLTMHDEPAYAQRAFDLGANAFLVKDDAEDQLAECLAAIDMGENYCSLGDLQLETLSDLQQLSVAERRILSLVEAGKSSDRIAEILSVSVRTVDNHRSHIAKKLGLRGTNALLKYAVKKNSNPV